MHLFLRTGSFYRALLFVSAFSALILLGSCRFLSGSHGNFVDSLDHAATLAGKEREFGEPFGIAVRGGEVLVSDGEKGTISRVGMDGSVSPLASGLSTPSGISVASNGDIIVADTGSNTIKKIGKDGHVSQLAGIENQRGFRDGDASTALFNGPISVAVLSDGAIFVSDTYNDRIRMIKDGIVTTVAGGLRGFADGTGSVARFDTPLGIALWNNDKLLVADSANGRIRVVERDGNTWTLSGDGSGHQMDGSLGTASFLLPTAVSTAPNGTIFIADGNSIRVIGRHAFPFVETISDRRQGLNDGQARTARLNRPSGLIAADGGALLIADSGNQVIRVFTDTDSGRAITTDEIRSLRYSAEEFRALQPPRWPYDPPSAKREIAGTLGEVRGEISLRDTPAWFHNGLDIAGSYGETARFVRSETVLLPQAVENFGGTRELIRMPTMGYIHIRLGRDQNDRPLGDDRFQFLLDANGKLTGVRIARGTRFTAGEAIGTLNSLNHVHLIAGRSGMEMNALDALVLPGVSDSIAPVIETVSIFDENWRPIETESIGGRIRLTGKVRIVARAYDRVDGNAERRRLGVYKLGYRVFREEGSATPELKWTIHFDRMPANSAVRFAYANGSKSGPTGETIFNYIVTNEVSGDGFAEGFLDTGSLEPGPHTLEVVAADFFGNSSARKISIEVTR